MSSRRRYHHDHRADVAEFRGRGDLITDLFEVGADLRGRPHAGLKRRTLTYYEAGSYTMSSWHQCFSCGWHFRTRARLAGAFLVAVRAADPRPTDAAIGAICAACWAGPNAKSLSEIEISATTLLRGICPGGSFSSYPSEGTMS